MYNILKSISFVNLYTELASVIRLAVVVVFFFLIWHPDVYNWHIIIIIIIIIITTIITKIILFSLEISNYSLLNSLNQDYVELYMSTFDDTKQSQFFIKQNSAHE